MSVARHAHDGVEVLDGKIYLVGGYNGSAKNIAERYDPVTNIWEPITSIPTGMHVPSSVLMGNCIALAAVKSLVIIQQLEIDNNPPFR